MYPTQPPQYAPPPMAPPPMAPPVPAQYAPPPAPQYAPPPAAPAPAGYAPAPAAPAPVAPAANVPQGFSAPSSRPASFPRIMDMPGRLLLIRPTKVERNLPNNMEPGTFKDRVTADVIVLDGGPLSFGGKPENGIPHTLTVQTPYLFEAQWIEQKVLVAQLERDINGAVLGRLGQAPSNNGRRPSWRLFDSTDADKAIATAYIHAERAGQVGRGVQPPAVGSAPAAAAPTPQYAPAPAPMAAPVPLPPPPPPPAPAAPAEPANPGYDPAWWATLPLEHKQHYASQAAAQAGQAQQPQAGAPANWH